MSEALKAGKLARQREQDYHVEVGPSGRDGGGPEASGPQISGVNNHVDIDVAVCQAAGKRRQERRESRLATGRAWVQCVEPLHQRLREQPPALTYRQLLDKVANMPLTSPGSVDLELQDPLLKSQMNEVDLSVETFDLAGLRVPVLRATMVETQAFVPDLKAALKRVLQAVCLRLHLKQTPTRPSVGPIDGLASLVMMLLAHNTEEEAFWLVVATVEELHARVCLFQGPAEFSGFVTESALLAESVRQHCPGLEQAAAATRQDLAVALSLISRRFLIEMTIDLMPMEASLHLITRFFEEHDDASRVWIAAAIAAFGCAEEGLVLVLRSGSDLLSAATEAFRSLESAAFIRHFEAGMAALEKDPRTLHEARERHEARLATQWGTRFSLVDCLEFPPPVFTPGEVAGLVRQIVVQKALGFRGMTKDHFVEALGAAVPHLSSAGAEALYEELDGDRENFLSYGQVLSAAAVLMEGGVLCRSRICFQGFALESDASAEGSLSTSQATVLIDKVLEASSTPDATTRDSLLRKKRALTEGRGDGGLRFEEFYRMVQNEVGWLRCFGKETVTQVLGEADLQADLPMRMLHPHDAATKKHPHRKTGGEGGAGGVRDCCAGGICAALLGLFADEGAFR